MVSEPFTVPARVRGLRCALVAGLVTSLAACGGGSDDAAGADASPVLTGWERGGILAHVDVQSYDAVATASAPGRLSWLGRARGDTDELAYFESIDGGHPDDIVLAEPAGPAGPTMTPLAVGTGDDGWVAVADVRPEPGGHIVGLAAWRGTASEAGGDVGPAAAVPGDSLVPAAGTSVAFDSVGVGRVGDTSVVVALTGPTPPEDDGPTGGPVPQDTAVWTATGDSGWEPAHPDLGVDDPLATIRVTGDGGRLVLAGVTAAGDAHLWSSEDGSVWDPIDDGGLPSGMAGIDMLTPLGAGDVAVGWQRDDDGATGTVVQRLVADDVADLGTVEPTPDGDSEDGDSEDGSMLDRGMEDVVVNDIAIGGDGDPVLVGEGYLPTGSMPVPLVWATAGGDGDSDGGAWARTRQPELAGRLDHRFRAVTTTADGTLAGIIIPYLGIDIELWHWQP